MLGMLKNTVNGTLRLFNALINDILDKEEVDQFEMGKELFFINFGAIVVSDCQFCIDELQFNKVFAMSSNDFQGNDSEKCFQFKSCQLMAIDHNHISENLVGMQSSKH